MTRQQAKEVQKKFTKHNPFVRLTPSEQKEANEAYRVLDSSKVCIDTQEVSTEESVVFSALF